MGDRRMLIKLVLLGTMTLTSYRPVPEQTDSTPTYTSIGDRTTRFGCAVSQDLLKNGLVAYGDILYIPGYGYRVVNDTMNARHKNHVDLLVNTHEEEKAVGMRHLQVFKVTQPMEATNVLQALSKRHNDTESQGTKKRAQQSVYRQPQAR